MMFSIMVYIICIFQEFSSNHFLIFAHIMKQILKLSSLAVNSSILNSLITPKSYRFTLFFRPTFNFYQQSSSLEKTERKTPHSQYTSHLKNAQWVSGQLQRIQYLLGHTHTSGLNYGHLRSVINELLLLCTHATNARPYHDILQFDAEVTLKAISKMMKMSFSENSNQTYQNIEEERKSTFQYIEFAAYFQICSSWNCPFDSQVLTFYLHSYMNLLFDRNLLKYITVFDVLRQCEPGDTVKLIINRSAEGIDEIMQILRKKVDKLQLLNPYQMAIYLKFLRFYRFAGKKASEKQSDAEILRNYILKSQKKLDESIYHCENLAYSFFLLFQLQEMKGSHIFLVSQWICQRFQHMITTKKHDNFLQYMMNLSSHEDKLTCLKIDIWLCLLAYEMPPEMEVFDIRPYIQKILVSINDLSFHYWRCKYIFWLMDSFLNKYISNSLPFIKRICSFLSTVSFRPYDKISPAVIFLKQVTQRHIQLSDIMSIHDSVATWMLSIPKKNLKCQDPSQLCDLLSLADSHPTLQTLYTPYLLTLLQMSLGNFAWTELTRVYYYGLRFGLQMHSQDAQWNMEYVRRYILNEYATMGLRRRQIPEDSYFYKIIGITTPEKFYQNYLKHQ